MNSGKEKQILKRTSFALIVQVTSEVIVLV